MANLTRILQALYCEPWLIRPEMHQHLCSIAWAHATGAAHAESGIVAEFGKTARGDVDDDVRMYGNVAVLEIGGVIGRKFSSFLNSSGVTSVDVLARHVAEAKVNPAVSALVLDVDSPGGTVTGTPEAANVIADFSRDKPVVAYASGLMASAAYWLSAPADAIFAAESADVGCIGVYTAMLDVTRAYENAGVKVELFKQGKYKAMGMPGVPLTDDQREYIQQEVDQINDWFRSTITGNRDVPDTAMEGQTFLGRRAVEVGLVDRIGTLGDAIDYAAEQAR